MKRKATGTYTRAEVEQHTELNLHLQRTNARASHVLLRLARLRPSHPHFKSLCAELASIADLLNLEISFSEEIVNNHVSQPIGRIIVSFGTTCSYCEEKPDLTPSEQDDNNVGPLTASPAWTTQLDSLTGLAVRVIHGIFGNSFPSGRETKTFLRCLNELHTAFRRQRRHLALIEARKAPEISVESDPSDTCPRCGTRY